MQTSSLFHFVPRTQLWELKQIRHITIDTSLLNNTNTSSDTRLSLLFALSSKKLLKKTSAIRFHFISFLHINIKTQLPLDSYKPKEAACCKCIIINGLYILEFMHFRCVAMLIQAAVLLLTETISTQANGHFVSHLGSD